MTEPVATPRRRKHNDTRGHVSISKDLYDRLGVRAEEMRTSRARIVEYVIHEALAAEEARPRLRARREGAL